jgi:hypothetical protein
LAGCATPPAPTYAPRVEVTALAAEAQLPSAGFALMSETPTQGRFACTLAVAKLVAQDADDKVNLRVDDLTPPEQAYWVESLRGVVEARDLIFLSPLTVRPDEERTPALCRAAREQGAALVLAYVPGQVGANSAQLLGVVYNTQSAAPLAVLHEEQTLLNAKGVEVTPDELAHAAKGARRDHDAYYQASRRFEHGAADSVRALVRLDQPPPSTQPSHWTPMLRHERD